MKARDSTKTTGQSGKEAFEEINQLLCFPEQSASLRLDTITVLDRIED